jgi:hypothetical protein
MSFNNVKFLLKDTNGKILVGKRLDSLIPYSAIGGKRESGESELQTLNRELTEESSNVLKLLKDSGNLYLVANDQKPYKILPNIKQKNINKQVYYLMETGSDLSKDISAMNQLFKKNQNNLVNQAFKVLRNKLPDDISDLQIFEWIIRFRNNYYSPYLKLILQNSGFKESDIKTIIDFIQNIGYSLEMDELAMVDLSDLKKGLYEQGIFLVDDPDFKKYFSLTK